MRRPTTAPIFSAPKPSLPTVPKATATAPVNENISPCQSPPPRPSLKESRTWEHDRQRFKKATTFIKSKSRKAHSQVQAQVQLSVDRDRWAAKHAQGGVVRTARSSASLRIDDDDPSLNDGQEFSVEENEVEWGATALALRVGGPDPDSGVPRKVEVPLADLLIARKPRHGRDPDFELVPSVRSVIVLDDSSVVPEPDFDEPWEHVYASDADENRSPELSYAKIAALN